MGKLILVMLQQTFVERQGRRRRIEGGAIFSIYTRYVYFFRQITTFIKVRMAFVFGLQTI